MPAGDPRWGEVLQLPNVNNDVGHADRAREIWLARQGEMGGAQSTALSALTAALKAQRDKQMADLAAADALRGRGGGGGGRGGGGGGAAPSTYQQYDNSYNPWIDDYLQTVGAQAAPTYGDSLTTNEKYGKGPPGTYPSYKNTLPKKPANVGAKGRGYRAPVKPRVATKYRTILS